MLPALHDDVIVLTGYTDRDISVHLAGAHAETAHGLGWMPQVLGPAVVKDAFAQWPHDWETGGSTRAFAARDQVTGRLLGGCELSIQPRGSARIRYWTFPAERGRGYATRGLVLLLRYARAIGLRQAEAHIAADNHAARRVAEKAGFLSAAAFTGADGTGMIQYLVGLPTWS